MWDVLGMVVALLLALYGCIEGLHRLCEHLLRLPPDRGMVVLVFRGHCEDAEFTLRCAAANRRKHLPVVAVDAGADEDTRAVMEAAAETLCGVECVTASTFCERFF